MCLAWYDGVEGNSCAAIRIRTVRDRIYFDTIRLFIIVMSYSSHYDGYTHVGLSSQGSLPVLDSSHPSPHIVDCALFN